MPIYQSGMRLTPARMTYQSGSTSVTFATATSFVQAVSFSQAFASVPRVGGFNINTASGSTIGWTIRATDVTTTGFNLRGYGTSAAWSGVPVQWHAFPI